ncbi:hypothetical protein [Rhodococcus erythropolis]|uniref:hypothetical protein n=1 Tax=Rhodococcus erythropolis TaxID=1833 RepID=UPI00177F6031|nr:hypothetical protein [Rhodococcus erythropolis]
MNEQVILATSEQQPIAEIELSIKNMRDMIATIEAGGAAYIKVYADRAVVVTR